MSQTETIKTPQDYVNYTFNVEARGVAELSSELMGLSNTASNLLGLLAFKTSEFLSHTETMAMGAGAAVSAMFVSATQSAIRFEQQIANVQAIGGEAINARVIGDAAMEYSNKFGMATASMTEGLEALARAGITTTDVMKGVLEEGVKLSKLEGMDLEDSINDLISTTNLLSVENVNMNDAQYAEMVKQMNQHIVSTSESAPINAQNIIQSLQHVGGYASAGGMDQDDLFAVIAQLGSRGTKGEMAGTALRAFIAAGQKDTAQRALARIGLNVSDLWNENGETMLSISEMKDVLDDALEARGYSKQEKLEFYSDFAGYKQANQIMKIDTTEVRQYKESIANAWDLGKKLDTILGTVRGNLDRIWQITQNFMTKVGGQILDMLNLILTPLRVGLELFTKIPFADKAVAAGMIFVAFRTGLMIFNKLVPAVAGFMSGLNKAKDATRGFRGEWQKTREEIGKTKEIISLLRAQDQTGLAKKHYEEHGLSAKNKESAERDVAAQMYVGTSLYEKTHYTPFYKLPTYTQDMFFERIKTTDEFKENYKTLVDRTKGMIDEAVSKPILIENFEGKGTLEAINTWVELIYNLLHGERTRGGTDGASGSSGSPNNRERNARARVLSDIFNNRVVGNSYGNVDFKYEQTEEGYQEAKAGLKKAYKDLRDYTKAFSNTDIENINNIQRNAYKKLFTQISSRGIEATKTANESEIRLVLEKGILESHENPWEGIKDSQVQYIADKLGLDDFKFYDSKQGDRRAEFARQARAVIEQKDESVRQGIIDEIINGADGTGGTNKIWEQSLQDVARGRKEFLLRNTDIADQIVSQLSNINTVGFDNNTEAVLAHFRDLDDNSTDWNVAIKAAMNVLKTDSGYSHIEENTIKYIIDNIARHKETILNFQANAEDLGLSQAIKDEIADVINDMQNDATLLRAGGEELGAAIVSGFIGDGLGRHSPGHMFWALVDEQTDISNAILQSRGLLNKNAGLLGLEITNAFDKNLGINRVFDSGIEFLRRDSDIIKDIIADFDRDEFRTDDEQDLEYDLLPSQHDVQDYLSPANKTALEHFVRPYGFDMSNYERFGSNFGRDWNDVVRFQSMMWFLKNDFDFEKMFDSGEFDEDAIYDYMGLVDKHFAIESTWLQLKTYPGEIDDTLYANMNTWLEDFYFIFLDTLSMNMREIISNSEGLVDNVKLYRGGRLPLTGENLGEYLGTASTSYTPRIADLYAADNAAVNYKTNVFAPEGVLGIYPNADLLGNKTFIDGVQSKNVYGNQIEYTLGNGQPFIELPNEATGQMSGAAIRNEADILLLTPTQVAAVTGVVVDEVSSMINSGRTDSNILNMNGVQAVNSLIGEKYEAETQIPNQPKQDSLWGHSMHDTERGMIYDAATYIKKTQNKRVMDPNEFFKLIESVNGAEAAENVKNFLYSHSRRDEFIKDNGKLKISPLITTMAKGNTQLWNTHKDLEKFGIDQIVTPRQIFDLIQKHPEIADELRKFLNPYVDIRAGEKPTQKFFEDKGYMDDTFVPLPYEYTWLLGSDVANGLVDHLGGTNPYRYGHKPQISLDRALKLWEQLGPEAILGSDFSYLYDDDLMPTVDNSFARMMMGLVYGTLDEKSGAYGSRSHAGGIHLYPHNTEFSGAEQTLNTLIHEFTHMALQQDYRHGLDESDELYLPQISDRDATNFGYGANYPWIADEFETNWVATQVFKLAGIDQLSHVNERVKGFYDITEKNGGAQHLQWELYDEWIKNISENIDKFIDIGEAFDRKYSDLSPTEISAKWDEVRALVNVDNNAADFALPGVLVNSGYIDYTTQQQNNQRKQMEDNLRDIKNGRYNHIMGVGVQAPKISKKGTIIEDEEDSEYENRINATMQTKYGALFPDMDNKFNKARYIVNKDGRGNQKVMAGIDFAEKVHNKAYKTTFSAISKIGESQDTEAADRYTQSIGLMKDGITNILEPMNNLNQGLARAAEVFPPLAGASWALSTAMEVAEAAIWMLDTAELFLSPVRIQNTLVTWGLATAEEAEAIATAIAAGATWLLTGAIGALEIIMTGPLLIAIAAVIAAIELLKFWENKHADALKESQKALEEATAKNNIALSQYKDLKKARENETDAMKKQQAARKEAIALYELEASRLQQRKAVHEEAKLRNDGMWGEYGLRASLQKIGLGFIAGGDFESQYENYDGTTANIRQIKESTLGNLFATREQRYAASVYDKNSMFFAEVEAYSKPLQALYDKESKLIEQYGSVDLARGTKEFEEAVQEFADATGLNGETAGKMLDWLETENRVNQATQAMRAQVNVITARADAKALSADVEDTSLLDDNHTLEQAMIMAQAQDIYQEAYDYMWWEKFQADLFGILWTILDHMVVWDWTDHATKYWKKSEAYEEGMKELAELGVRGVSDIGNEMAENADRRDYGAGSTAYSDSPFGAALESAELMEAEYSQQMALERRYTMDETRKFQKELNEGMIQTGQSGVEGFQTGLDQHSPGAISRSMGDEMIYTQEAIQENYDMLMLESHQIGENSVISFKDGLGQDPEGNISKSVNDEMLYTQEAFENNREPIKELSYDIGYESGEQYGQGFMDGLKSLYEQISTPEALTQSLEDRILVRQGYGVPEGANPNDPEVQAEQAERRAETESKLFVRSGVGSEFINVGKSEGKAAWKVASKEGVNWQNASVVGRIVNSAEIAASDGLKAGAKALFAPKNASHIPTGKVAGAVDDTLKGAGKYGSKALGKLGIDTSADMGGKALGWVARNFGDDAAKGAAKLGGKAAKAIPFLGTAMTAAFSIAEHNPFEKHYNEDGSEKRAFQSTGEVAGAIAGSLAADAIGVVAGPVAGMLAGFVLEPIGEAIGGTIGWLTDEVVNTKFTDAWAGFNDALGGIPNQIVGFIDQSPIGQAGHFVFNQLDNLTGGWLGETWDKVQNSSIMELPGVIGEQLWNGATGLWDSLTGGNNQGQQKLPDIGEKMPNVPQSNTGTQSTVIIKNININTEDDPEKIKSALMNLIIEMQEQISPRQVSRTVGEPPVQSTSTTQNENNTPEAEGTDAQSGAQNGDQNNNPTT